MLPIRELLNRIRWDPEFARGNFELGYYDRAEDRIIPVPFAEVSFPAESPQTFQLTDAQGRSHRIPFHRVREVYRDSQRIWNRPATPQSRRAAPCRKTVQAGAVLNASTTKPPCPSIRTAKS
jgi:uncharacterized protein (UPF0248 family)